MAIALRLAGFSQADLEYKRLEQLWLALQFSLDIAKDDVAKRVREQRSLGNSELLSSDGHKSISKSHYIFLQKIKSQIPKYAREVIYVRLVSTFEVMLVDVVRDLFLNSPEIFYDQNRQFQISHAELLSAKDLSKLRNRLINDELRQLHSKGLKDISKYFDKKIGIKFSDLGVNLNLLWEMVDRRHLLVHRLGRADEPYRRKYGYEPRAPLTIDHQYLADGFDMFRKFSLALEQKISDKFDFSAATGQETNNRIDLQIEIESASVDGDRVAKRDFGFVVHDRDKGERTAQLADIWLGERVGENGERILLVGGTDDEIDAYLKALRKRQKAGLLSYSIVGQRVIRIRPKSVKMPDIPLETIEEIARRLPPEPWPTGVHKEIAKELGISNNMCSYAITFIRSNERLWSLIGSEKLP